MPNPKFVNKINFLQEPGTSETVMPSDDLLMYLEKYIVAPAEEMCEYGIYSKAREIPIFFVSEKTINQKRLAIARGVFFDLRKLLEFVDGDRFWKLWENEFNTTERLLVKDDFDEALEGTLVKWTDPIGLYLPKGEFQDQGPEIWVSYEKIRNLHQKWKDSKYTTALTLVHELGHAIMDAPTSGLDCLNTWVEEPLANMIALHYLYSVGSSDTNGYARIDYVTDFVEKQPEKYALGLNLFRSNREFDWKAWKNAKGLLCSKSEALMDWVEYINENMANVDDRRLEDLFREIVRQPIEFN
ncbi:hypothetical protein [Fibrobacter sp.]|uniref:hypothetical protein n=1 Tax=Fibrobacter sp. TaxID=35828 RepID=UPI0025C204A5|nr:hypothetical protein [Fibrobacter sp.]